MVAKNAESYINVCSKIWLCGSLEYIMSVRVKFNLMKWVMEGLKDFLFKVQMCLVKSKLTENNKKGGGVNCSLFHHLEMKTNRIY